MCPLWSLLAPHLIKGANCIISLYFFSRDADDAVYECNGKDLMGDRVSVEIAKGTPHGRDKDRWGHGSQGGRRGSRDRSR